MTSVPDIENNTFEFKSEENKFRGRQKKKINRRPWITFGITIYNKKDRFLLYTLEYLKIDKIVSECIEDFLECFLLDIEKFVESEIDIKWKA